ncbi:glycosyltransferase family 4 protein [Chitinophaga cymbidii]|uniref:Glycosyl transferase family 1 n=1 Tax=Chitinophaga cymbidii TaxID=1096750 RepID=A0A512RQ87_9BACT|nr:glycosyltransferase family 1 protein [Chitinophaga cymbidii]GEP97859.1 glycosyl transferase family 1 [Chitinophaga cymbidii]
MNIGFDAKRAFQNRTGLGNYSRTLIRSLAEYYPQHQYFLFAPRLKPLFQPPPGMQSIQPEKALHRWLRPVWRGRWVVDDLKRHHIGLYHGLSAELPSGIRKSGIKSVVTMHDLIFERYPEQYNPIDVFTYRKKAQYACRQADQVIAISEQTKQDLIEFYHIPAERITVAYQSCDPSFMQLHSKEAISGMLARYNLPQQYFLYVGSVIERKNLLGITKAMALLKGKLDLPLVVLGDGRKYKEEVKSYLRATGLAEKVIWLNETGRFAFEDLPALYQGAAALLYPSVFEGFGIPILEALWCRTPVITSQGSCFLETGGDAAFYVDPYQPATIAEAMERVVADPALAEGMRERGVAHAQRFTVEKCAAAVMKVYESI